MILQRSAQFDADLEQQFRWYLLATKLEPADSLRLATLFADAVDAALETLRQNPEIGRQRFQTAPDLIGTRSWGLPKPFCRFIIFYRFDGKLISAERLLEGHRRLAGEE